MAVVATPVTCSVALILDKGQDDDGKTIVGRSSLNGLAAGADNTKLYNVAVLLADCVAFPVVRVLKTESVELGNE